MVQRPGDADLERRATAAAPPAGLRLGVLAPLLEKPWPPRRVAGGPGLADGQVAPEADPAARNQEALWSHKLHLVAFPELRRAGLPSAAHWAGRLACLPAGRPSRVGRPWVHPSRAGSLGVPHSRAAPSDRSRAARIRSQEAAARPCVGRSQAADHIQEGGHTQEGLTGSRAHSRVAAESPGGRPGGSRGTHSPVGASKVDSCPSFHRDRLHHDFGRWAVRPRPDYRHDPAGCRGLCHLRHSHLLGHRLCCPLHHIHHRLRLCRPLCRCHLLHCLPWRNRHCPPSSALRPRKMAVGPRPAGRRDPAIVRPVQGEALRP
mmetsp:Transcript_127673/g.408673  ORF Transcript_127673/g.408673 Transcript_127673/m.408673 type:complete len:318 (-) Transcript_127673:316-1269(-)